MGDEAAARRLIAAHPFATLVTGGAGGVRVTHLPLLLEGDALVGHVARPNPHWQAFEDGHTVAVFHGPHAFISRGWYRDPADNVPTWNYAAVHASGRPQLLDAPGAQAAVSALAARFEPPELAPIAPEKMARLLEGIVAFRMPIERLEVKFKMSQNKPAERDGLIAGLRGRAAPGDEAVATWMAAE